MLDRRYAKNGQTLGDLCLDMDTMSPAKHLGILEDADIAASQMAGREKLHFINPVPINELAERWSSKFEQPRQSTLSDLKTDLEGENHE